MGKGSGLFGNKDRCFVQISLLNINTKTSGDTFGSTGEWIIKIDKERTPTKGYMKLYAGANYTPNPPIQLFTGFYTGRKILKLKLRVIELDVLINDTMLKDVININTGNQTSGEFTFNSKNKKVQVTLFVSVQKSGF